MGNTVRLLPNSWKMTEESVGEFYGYRFVLEYGERTSGTRFLFQFSIFMFQNREHFMIRTNRLTSGCAGWGCCIVVALELKVWTVTLTLRYTVKASRTSFHTVGKFSAAFVNRDLFLT